MKNKIQCLVRAALFLVFLFCFTNTSFAYSVETHALLTNETAEFFNSKYTGKIPAEQIRYLVDGARREDDAPRWLSHFYDPIKNRGLTYDQAIDPGFTILQVLGNQASSKDLALNGNLQKGFLYRVASKLKVSTVASILSSEELKNIKSLKDDVDFSWDKALKLYISGDEEGAMFALGHVIHLIQDASVPDHTRNDPHTGDSPYENYTSAFNLNNPDNNLKSRLSAELPINLAYLNDGFSSIAQYSNENFYSKDTIGIQSGYSLPQPDYEQAEGDYVYSIREANGVPYKLFLKQRNGIFGSVVNIAVSLSTDDSEELVLQDYWSRLSTKSVVYGAGVVDLFFREAERLKDDEEFNKENKSFIAKIAEGIKNAFANMFNPPEDGLIAEIPPGNSESGNKEQGLSPFVFVDKTSVYPGETLIESGSGFTPGGVVTLLFSSPSGKSASASATADGNGQFNFPYPIPSSAETGTHQYWAKDETTGFTTDKIKYLIVPLSDKKPEQITDDNQTKQKDSKQEENQPLSLPKECSFSGDGSASGGKRIVLNEIAWMGSTESSSGEWIELKNISSSDMDVSGWWVMDQMEQIKTILPNNAKISAGRFYLLERGDDDSLPDVKADMIYTGTLSNTKEGLRLFNPDCQIEDEVIANPDWPAGNSADRKTMERKPNLSGWHTSSFVDGTPKQENSAGTAAQDDKKESEPIRSGGGSSISYCKQTDLAAPSGEVIINETAWAGDAESSSNEWIELHNPGDEEISLNRWQLLDKAENIKIIFDSGDKIPAKGYLLAMRGSENFIPGISANKFYSGSINNSDEELRLFNANCSLVDEIKDTGTNWKNIGGSAGPDYKTAERLLDGSWHSYSGPAGAIMGTPKAANSPKVVGVESPDENDEGDENEDDENNGSGSTWGSSAQKVVISEIMPGVAGGANNEFIELYNPTGNDISLDGWYLARKATMESEPVNLVSKSSGLFNGKTIPPKSFFLIASQSYSGNKIPDVVYSQNSSHLANNGDIIVFYTQQDEPSLVVEYPEIETGKSLERKAYADGVCYQSAGEYEFSGNGCNADAAVVWNTRSNPNPQSLASLPEPRSKPVWPFTTSDVIATYNPDKIAVDVEWPSFIGTARISNGDKVVWMGSGVDEEKRIKVYELGEEQKFNFEIVDADGLAADEKANFSVTAPRIITDFKLYSDAKYDFDEQESERDILEFSWNEFPFVPYDIGLVLAYGEPPSANFKVMVFYKNMDGPSDEFLYYENPRPEYAENVLEICYRDDIYYQCRKNLVFSDSGSTEYYEGAPFTEQIRPDFYLAEGDKHVALPVSGLQSGDYLTVGYYAFYRSYPPGTADEYSSKSFVLVAKDNNHIQIGTVPAHNPPSAPTNLKSEVQTKEGEEGPSLRLITTWNDSVDTDTPDGLIRYEISYDEGATWNRTTSGDKIVPLPGTTYVIQVRAVDDFGVYSDIVETSVTAPLLPVNILNGIDGNGEEGEGNEEDDNKEKEENIILPELE